jgi:hypothetical protein
MPWPIFWAAYLGRITLAFKQAVPSDADVWGSNVFAVRGARERFRKQDSSDLAQVLATLTYSKKTKPYDMSMLPWDLLDYLQTIISFKTSTSKPQNSLSVLPLSLSITGMI